MAPTTEALLPDAHIPQEIRDLYMSLAFARSGSSGAVTLQLDPVHAHRLETALANLMPEYAAQIDMIRRGELENAA